MYSFWLQWEMSRYSCNGCWSRWELPIHGAVTGWGVRNHCCMYSEWFISCNTLPEFENCFFYVRMNQCFGYKNSFILLRYEIMFWVGQKGVELLIAMQRIADNSGCASGSVPIWEDHVITIYNPLLQMGTSLKSVNIKFQVI